MFTFLLGWFCFFQILFPADPDAASARFSIHGEANPANMEEVSDPAGDFAELLDTVRTTSPGLYRRICSLPRRALLEALMNAACSEVRAVDSAPSSETPRTFHIFSGRLLEDKRVFYLRMDGLSETSLAGARDELHQSLASSLPSAMILDLRNADSGSDPAQYDFVPIFLRLLSRAPKIGEWYGPRPLAVLVSHKTSGAAAFLAACLTVRKNARPAVTVGTATTGSCFPSVVRQACGTEWRIPLIAGDDADGKIPTGVLDPVFPIDGPSGQIDFRKLADPQAVSADPVLRSSLDLVLALSVLKEPAAK